MGTNAQTSGSRSNAQRYDVIVVGGGHNGVSCAAFLAKGARVMLGSIDAVLEERFEREEITAPIAAYSAKTFGPTTETGTGFRLAFPFGIHQWGVNRPVGGSGAFTKAIANAARHHGGEIRVSSTVKRVLTHHGTVRVLDHYELYAPGTRDLIIDTHLTALQGPSRLRGRAREKAAASMLPPRQSGCAQ